MEARPHYEWANDHMHEDVVPLFLDSVSFLSCALRKLLDVFGLEATKSWYATILIQRKT